MIVGENLKRVQYGTVLRDSDGDYTVKEYLPYIPGYLVEFFDPYEGKIVDCVLTVADIKRSTVVDW